MEKIIAAALLLLAVVQPISGAPTQAASSRTPCLDRHRQISKELQEYNKIVSKPEYIPECDESGRFWMPQQCSYKDRGYCFCVIPETGEIKQSTVSHFHSRESLECVPTAPANDTRLCQLRRDKYLAFRRQHNEVIGDIFYYYPDCVQNGSFKALQRDSVGFFCVDTELGTKIPDSEEISPAIPLMEPVCQAYSEQWKNYLAWLQTTRVVSSDHDDHEEVVNASSCKPGFEFLECGCASVCQPGNNMEELDINCEDCAPVCTCPEGYYENNGSCISGEECMEAEQPEEQHNVVDTYGAVWREYQADHPNQIIMSYRKQTDVFRENGDTSEYSPGQENEENPTEEEIEIEEEESTTTEEEIELEEEEEWLVDPTTQSPDVIDLMEAVYVNEEEDPSETPSSSTATMDDYYTMEEEADYDGTSTPSGIATPESLLMLQIIQSAVRQQQLTNQLLQEFGGMASQLAAVQEQIQSVLESGQELTTIRPLTKATTEIIEAEFEDISSPLKKSGVNPPPAPTS